MDQRQIIKVVSKSLGLLCLVYAFLSVKQLIIYGVSIDFNDNRYTQSLSYFGQLSIGFTFDIVVAVVLIYKADLISRILTRDSNERVNLGVSKFDLIQLVIVFIGGLAIVDAIPEILSRIAQYLYFNQYGRDEMGLFWTDSENKTEIVYSVVKLAIGLIFIANGGLVAKWVTRVDRREDSTVE